jgi:hypothetical protein
LWQIQKPKHSKNWKFIGSVFFNTKKMIMRLSVIILLFLLFQSCEQEENKISCIEIPPSAVDGQPWNYDFGDDKASIISNNPNNSQEVAIWGIVNLASKEKGISIVNYITGTRKIVLYCSRINNLLWMENDWLVFWNVLDFQIYKVRPNGEDLAQLTFEPSKNNSPTYTNEPNIFAYSNLSESGNWSKIYMNSETNEVVDSLINRQTSPWASEKNDSLTIATGAAVVVGHSKQDSFWFIIDYDKMPCDGAGIEWIDSRRYIWTCGSQVFTGHIDQKNTYNKIIDDCQSVIYAGLYVNKQESRVYCRYIERSVRDENTLLAKNRICSFNFEGKNMKFYDIPNL